MNKSDFSKDDLIFLAINLNPLAVQNILTNEKPILL
jgi:hypothetical protein